MLQICEPLFACQQVLYAGFDSRFVPLADLCSLQFSDEVGLSSDVRFCSPCNKKHCQSHKHMEDVHAAVTKTKKTDCCTATNHVHDGTQQKT